MDVLKVIKVAVLTLLPGIAHLSAADGAPGTDLDKKAVISFFDKIVPDQLSQYNIAGATIAVTQGDRVLMVKGYGKANIETGATVDGQQSVFRIASVSKLFIWTSVMQLVEKGILDLDEDVNTYLDFTIPDRFLKPITLWHLMTHTPGFEDKNIGISVRGYEQLEPLGKFLKDYLPARVKAPGAQGAYSNYGAALSAYIVQRVSGIPFEDYAEKNIFRPLGMADTTYRQPLPDRLAARLVTGYDYQDGRYVEGPFEYIQDFPAGSVSTTAADMAKFSIAHIAGSMGRDTPILTASSMKKMQAPQFANHPGAVAMGLGFEGKWFNGRRLFGHGGDISHFKSRILLYPDARIGIFMAFNASDVGAARHNIFQEFFDAFVPGLLTGDLKTRSDAMLTDEVASDYVSNRRAHSTLEKLFWYAAAGVTVSRVSDGVIDVGIFGDTHRFRRISRGLYEGADGPSEFGRLIFETDNNTGLTNLYFSQFGSMHFEEAPFSESVSVHGRLLVLCLGLFLILPPLILWRSKKMVQGKGAVKTIGIVAVFIGILSVVFMVGAAANINEELMFGVPVILKLLLVIPVLCAVAILVLSGFALTAYRRGSLTLSNGLPVLLFIAVTLLYLWQLSVWNFLGWHF